MRRGSCSSRMGYVQQGVGCDQVRQSGRRCHHDGPGLHHHGKRRGRWRQCWSRVCARARQQKQGRADDPTLARLRTYTRCHGELGTRYYSRRPRGAGKGGAAPPAFQREANSGQDTPRAGAGAVRGLTSTRRIRWTRGSGRRSGAGISKSARRAFRRRQQRAAERSAALITILPEQSRAVPIDGLALSGVVTGWGCSRSAGRCQGTAWLVGSSGVGCTGRTGSEWQGCGPPEAGMVRMWCH